MYTLRIIEETCVNETNPFQQIISNHELGNAYSVFGKETDRYKDEVPDDMKPKVKMLIVGVVDSFWVLLNSENETFSYFIMTDSGKTFERL